MPRALRLVELLLTTALWGVWFASGDLCDDWGVNAAATQSKVVIELPIGTDARASDCRVPTGVRVTFHLAPFVSLRLEGWSQTTGSGSLQFEGPRAAPAVVRDVHITLSAGTNVKLSATPASHADRNATKRAVFARAAKRR